mmetsp:Transcript_23721/g.66512  ORF Transcript_23721/g.66512 Transcript_23721/m.66512 type:complete len:343 (+) Transcript_23721:817-1845(+)
MALLEMVLSRNRVLWYRDESNSLWMRNVTRSMALPPVSNTCTMAWDDASISFLGITAHRARARYMSERRRSKKIGFRCSGAASTVPLDRLSCVCRTYTSCCLSCSRRASFLEDTLENILLLLLPLRPLPCPGSFTSYRGSWSSCVEDMDTRTRSLRELERSSRGLVPRFGLPGRCSAWKPAPPGGSSRSNATVCAFWPRSRPPALLGGGGPSLTRCPCGMGTRFGTLVMGGGSPSGGPVTAFTCTGHAGSTITNGSTCGRQIGLWCVTFLSPRGHLRYPGSPVPLLARTSPLLISLSCAVEILLHDRERNCGLAVSVWPVSLSVCCLAGCLCQSAACLSVRV